MSDNETEVGGRNEQKMIHINILNYSSDVTMTEVYKALRLQAPKSHTRQNFRTNIFAFKYLFPWGKTQDANNKQTKFDFGWRIHADNCNFTSDANRVAFECNIIYLFVDFHHFCSSVLIYCYFVHSSPSGSLMRRTKNVIFARKISRQQNDVFSDKW